IIWYESRTDPELRFYAVRVPDRIAPAVHLHNAILAHALTEILVGRPNAYLGYAGIRRGDESRRGQRIVRFELDHRPHRNSHGGESLLQRLKLGKECRLDALGRLIPAPEFVAKRFDDMIGGDSEMRRSLLDHLQHAAQHTDNSPERPVLAVGGTPETI